MSVCVCVRTHVFITFIDFYNTMNANTASMNTCVSISS